MSRPKSNYDAQGEEHLSPETLERSAPGGASSGEVSFAADGHRPSAEECRRCRSMLDSAAHDLRAPLTVVIGYIDLLLSGKAGSLTETQVKILRDMSSSATHLQRFTKDFLSFRLVDSLGSQVNLQAADLNECLRETCGVWAPQFQAKGTGFYVFPAEGLPLFPFDYWKVQHILSNLLENAFKFTPAGHTVWVHVDPYVWRRSANANAAQPDSDDIPNSARVTVSDDGPGIPPEFHQDIFNESWQVIGSDQNEAGFGLGLAIARRLIEFHGGKIWVESEPGAGSKFCFVLPFSPQVKN
jgi:signal transduction histidine kinase